MVVEKGNKVKVEYEGKLDSGEVFDSSTHGDHSHPMEFEVGSGKVIKGFDEAVIGMNEGEEKTFTLPSAEAYGDVRPELVKKVPKDKMPQDQEIKPGMMLALGTPDGQQIPARITDVNDKEITIDLNHPLAGKTLNFKIKIVE